MPVCLCSVAACSLRTPTSAGLAPATKREHLVNSTIARKPGCSLGSYPTPTSRHELLAMFLHTWRTGLGQLCAAASQGAPGMQGTGVDRDQGIAGQQGRGPRTLGWGQGCVPDAGVHAGSTRGRALTLSRLRSTREFAPTLLVCCCEDILAGGGGAATGSWSAV